MRLTSYAAPLRQIIDIVCHDKDVPFFDSVREKKEDWFARLTESGDRILCFEKFFRNYLGLCQYADIMHMIFEEKEKKSG